MKRIISILMAALMLCVLCVTASAEDTAVVVTPTTNDENIVEICLTEPGNYFIKKDCTLDRLVVMDCTLTIAEGVTVTVTMHFGNMDGVLNIGSGAVFEYGCYRERFS